MTRALALPLLFFCACGGDLPAGSDSDGSTSATTGTATASDDPTAGTTGDPGDGDPILLDPRDRLLRISMALRGVRPSDADYAAVEADPKAMSKLVDAYLDSPDFGATVRDLHNDALLVLADFGAPPAGFLAKDGLAGMDLVAANRAIMEAPLRLIEHVVTGDRPYSEIVTADYTLVSAASAAAWGLPFDPAGDPWQVQEPPSDLRNAGVLADSWLFQRHGSTRTNANRGRANAVARAFLCVDFNDRDLEIDPSVNLADPEAVADAVQENATCAACHQTLDPLAAFFWGYKPQFVPLLVDYPQDHYAEGFFTTVLGVPRRDPHYFGSVGGSLADLGALLSVDPRFSLCAARRAYAYFHQTDLAAVPLDRAGELQAVLQASDDYKAMIKALVLADDFARGDGELGRKRARPFQLARLVEDLTGFRWRSDLTDFGAGVLDLMDDSLIGYHVLAGGLDAIFVNTASYTYSATTSLVLRALARQAANDVVEDDFALADKAARRLFTLVSAVDTGQAKLRPQIALLHRRFFGRDLADDAPEVSETLELFKAALALAPGDARRAWKITLTALLQDVRIAFY
ncbi:Protein of unknown function [Nannocystis exedens]|uniref:Uncharacterized protein n=1 Tax=Nannocystis exedens TaxID=54 RepID=A0A1I2FR98_9BACT|nr:DUF1588 domain-containing protein [Nannocystis exedens]PCC74525.1 hypothetical protein NAEX_07621 [Nannocystis exedens]SFF07150.1 Protein of unknown function [Nannocystis exedens]